MGIRRKFMSINSFGLIPFRSNGDKLAKMEKKNRRDEKVNTKKDRNLQEQILAEQRRANDLKEQELRQRAARYDDGYPPLVPEPTDQDWKDAAPKESLDPHSWWDYSNPGKKSRRG